MRLLFKFVEGIPNCGNRAIWAILAVSATVFMGASALNRQEECWQNVDLDNYIVKNALCKSDADVMRYSLAFGKALTNRASQAVEDDNFGDFLTLSGDIQDIAMFMYGWYMAKCGRVDGSGAMWGSSDMTVDVSDLFEVRGRWMSAGKAPDNSVKLDWTLKVWLVQEELDRVATGFLKDPNCPKDKD